MDTKVKVAVIITDDKERILLIKEKLKKIPVPLWNVVKGTYDGGETVYEAAERECKEEVSLNVRLVQSLGVYVSEGSGKIRVQFNFLAEAEDDTAEVASREEQELRNEAIEEVRWFTKKEIRAMRSEEFVSAKVPELLWDWMSGKSFSLDAYKQVGM